MKNKKAYVRTIEVTISLLITLFFIAMIIPRHYPVNVQQQSLDVMDNLREDQTFRNCIMGNETSCIETRIRQHVSNKYNYNYTISADPNLVFNGLPDKRVFAESAYFAGNDTLYSPKVFRLYYWVS